MCAGKAEKLVASPAKNLGYSAIPSQSVMTAERILRVSLVFGIHRKASEAGAGCQPRMTALIFCTLRKKKQMQVHFFLQHLHIWAAFVGAGEVAICFERWIFLKVLFRNHPHGHLAVDLGDSKSSQFDRLSKLTIPSDS